MKSESLNLHIKTTVDNFGGQVLYIDLPKRKAWNLLLKNGGIVQPNKRYILHERIYWHNNSLLHRLIGEKQK